MRIGAHGLVWSGDFTTDGMAAATAAARRAGFDVLEIPLFDPFRFDVPGARRALEEHGIEATASLALPAGADISTGEAAQRRAGEELLNAVVDVLAQVGARHLCGVLHSRLHKYGAPATPQGREAAQAVLRRVATRAADAGIEVSLEVVNRYESNLFNTAREALRFLDEVDHPNLGLHLDTYHMNIEEPDMYQPVLEGARLLRYVHIGESNRGYLGTGSVDFRSFFTALRTVGYDGPITFEAFSSAIVSRDLSNDLAIWRNLWDDGDDLGAHANSFIRGALRATETLALH